MQFPEGAACDYGCRVKWAVRNPLRGIGIKPERFTSVHLLRVESKIACTLRIQPFKARIQNGDFMPEPRDSAAGQPRPDPNEKLVKVFDSENESEALVVKGLLESAGIDSDLTAASMVQDTFPGLGGMIILVREEDAQAARNVIAEHKSLPDDETAEFQITEEPEQKP
jgi:Putative prokaryotic signal transducing protein